MMKMSARLLVASLLLPLAVFAADAPDEEVEPGLNAATLEGLELRNIGPAFMSGRIADIVLHPEDPSTWYVAVGSGGVWKTTNSGTTWEPIFDDQSSYSIGCITLDPNDPDTVWVGTGENVSGRHVGYGDGLYRSRDGGETWERMGLEESEHIGMIRIDPRDSNVIWVAAQGPLWSAGGQRGLYKSVDGGETWEKLLGDDEYTGANEVHLDPRDPDVVYAVTWQRYRNVAALMNGGPGSGIHKSEDGGETWRELTEGLPEEDMGKIGLAISPQDPDVVYATIELARRTGGFWRSEDGGETWEKRNDYLSGGTGPHYYQELFASPHAFDRVYQMDVFLHVTHDGGENFTKTEYASKHVDHHAMAFRPDDPDYLIVGTDGGIYESFDLGENWRYAANLPITQFYKVSVDYDEPFYNIYGGTQDNSTQGGPARTANIHGITNSDWFIALGGDGHEPEADPTNPDIVYTQWQQGNLNRYDRRTGETVYIQPQPGRGEPEERFNWDAPILISPHDPARLYFGSQRLWRSDSRGDEWQALSGDLTRDVDRLRQPMMGTRWSFDAPWDLYAMSRFSTIANLDESPLVEGLIYVGTDDGLIQVTEDGGETWREIDSLPGVPDYFYVNDIKADLHDPDTVYVAVDNHKAGDFEPYILKSTNRGRSWRSISDDLPDRHIVWRVIQDHVDPDLLFAATEFGLFFTVDGGGNWTELDGGIPTISFRDLEIQRRENDLVAASFGRGFFVLDDYTPLRNVSEDTLAGETVLFPVRDAAWYVPRDSLGCGTPGCRSTQGAGFYVAPNPPFGAVFTYYLPEKIRSREEQRQEREKELKLEGAPIPFPDWDAVLAEELEQPPAVWLTVRDAAGEVVRHIEAPAEAGFHRVAWDLRYPDLNRWEPESEEEPSPWEIRHGVLAEPGEYSVTLARRVNGRVETVGEAQSFRVSSIREPVLEGPAQSERVRFDRRVAELGRAVSAAVAAAEELVEETGAIKDVLTRSTADPALYATAQDIEERARRLSVRLTGHGERAEMGDAQPVSISRRLNVAGFGNTKNAYGPTGTQRTSLEIAEAEFAEVKQALDQLLEVELAGLKERLNAAGVPWSPGRGVPLR